MTPHAYAQSQSATRNSSADCNPAQSALDCKCSPVHTSQFSTPATADCTAPSTIRPASRTTQHHTASHTTQPTPTRGQRSRGTHLQAREATKVLTAGCLHHRHSVVARRGVIGAIVPLSNNAREAKVAVRAVQVVAWQRGTQVVLDGVWPLLTMAHTGGSCAGLGAGWVQGWVQQQ